MRFFIVILISSFFCLSSRGQEMHPSVSGALQFSKSIQSDDLAAAYAGTSEKFRKVNSLDDFRGFLAESGVAKWQGFTPGRATANQDQSLAIVNLKAKDSGGKSRTVTVGMIKEPDAYRMEYFFARPGGISGIPPVDDAEAATVLAEESLKSLAAAIKSGDFSSYLSTLPMKFRQQYGNDTIASLGKQLNATRYGPASAMPGKLEFNGPGTWSDGHARYRFDIPYPDRKRKLRLHFIAHTPESETNAWPNRWELVYFPAASPALAEPEEAEASGIIRTVLTDLFAGFRAGDLKAFPEAGAPFFREVVPLSRFAGAFPAFTGENAVDFSEWKPEEAEILESSLIGDHKAVWKAEVVIPTPNQPVYATLNLMNETGAWQFSGVTVHSKSPEQRRSPSAK